MPNRPTTRALRRAAGPILLALFALGCYFGPRQVVLAATVDGASMAPTLRDHQQLWVNRQAYRFADPARGDVVLFAVAGEVDPYVKRVVGLPGERVAIRDGVVSVDGVVLTEPYARGLTDCDAAAMCNLVVPDGTVFVLGDNRPDSEDSRWLGPVAVERIAGKAWGVD